MFFELQFNIIKYRYEIFSVLVLVMAGILDEIALRKLSKEDLVVYALNVSNIVSKVDKLVVAVADLKTRLETSESRLEASESQILIVQNVNMKLQAQIDHLRGKQINTERIMTNNAQYLRNRQIEIKNFDVNISDGELKPRASEILSLTGVEIKSTDLGKCHRLNNKNNIIIEFYDRDTRDNMLRARKNLKDKGEILHELNMDRAMILESLCPDYSCLDFICRKLQKSGALNQSWFFNGRLWIKVNEDSEKLQITHITELHNMFGVERVDNILSQ